MKMYAWIIGMALGCSVAAAQAPDGGITLWPKGMPPGGIAVRADFGDHLLEISHREVSGKVEQHQVKADVIVIQTGTATLITGGEMLDPTPTGPNELQGTSIRGGVKHDVGPGDVIEIPPGVPHQFILAPGTQITYLVVKVIRK